MLVDTDLTPLAGDDAKGVQAKLSSAGDASGADDHHIAAQLTAVVHGEDGVGAVAVSSGHGGGSPDIDAVDAHPFAEQFPDAGLLPGQQRRRAFHDGDLRPKPAQELAEFRANGAAAKHDHSIGDLG